MFLIYKKCQVSCFNIYFKALNIYHANTHVQESSKITLLIQNIPDIYLQLLIFKFTDFVDQKHIFFKQHLKISKGVICRLSKIRDMSHRRNFLRAK